ncbi:MAG TPA: hypothetical protein VKH40_16960 [Alloacidobacterium sp.]|nr:hypothetical protein [Alloacidobacterium sp.]
MISSLALVLNAAAYAGPTPPPPPTPTAPKKAPEIDPGLAISGVSLLVGSLTVLRSRRDK